MENRLENIDSIVKDALHNIEFPYQPADWEAMESRIENDAFLRTRLYWLKGSELLLMLLAFWVLFQFFGMTYPQPIPSRTEPQPQKLKTPPPAKQNNIVPPRKEEVLRENEEEETEPEQEEEADDLHFAQKMPVEAVPATIMESEILPEVVTHQEVEELLARVMSDEVEETIEAVPVAEQIGSFSERILPTKLVLLDNEIEGFTTNETVVEDPVPAGRKFPMNFSIAASPDMNTAKSSSYRMGMSLGGFTSVELSDKWQLQTGLAYSGKFLHDLPMDEERFPNMADVTKDMNMHIVEIPLHLQYTIKKSTNWRPFITAGVTANVAMFADYNFNNGGESPFDNKREAGVFEGGRLGDNVYATADIGLGLERQLDKNLHLFIQPTVRFALDDVGAHHDRINTFSLVMGARTAL